MNENIYLYFDRLKFVDLLSRENRISMKIFNDSLGTKSVRIPFMYALLRLNECSCRITKY